MVWAENRDDGGNGAADSGNGGSRRRHHCPERVSDCKHVVSADPVDDERAITGRIGLSRYSTTDRRPAIERIDWIGTFDIDVGADDGFESHVRGVSARSGSGT